MKEDSLPKISQKVISLHTGIECVEVNNIVSSKRVHSWKILVYGLIRGMKMTNLRKDKMNPLLKASIYYIVGNGLGQGMVLLGNIIFTRIMNQSDYGIYSTYYSTVSILTTIVGANLFVGLNNGYIDYKNDIQKFRSSVLILSTLIFIFITIISFVGNFLLNIEISEFFLGFAMLHAYSFFVVNYYNNSATMENAYRKKTLCLILPNIMQMALSITFIYMVKGNELFARVVGSTLGVTVCSIFLYFNMLKEERQYFNKEYWRYALKISVPSVLSSISYMILQQCDKVMVTRLYSATENAIYSLVYYIGYVLYAILQATSGVWQAWLYHSLDTGNIQNMKKVQKWYLFVFAQMAFGLYMIAPEFLKLLAPSNYWKFDYVAPFVLGSCLMVMYSFYTGVGMFYKKSGQVSVCVFIAALINLLLNYLLIPKYGGVAAAYTSVIAYVILFLLSRQLAQKMNRQLFSDKYFIVFLMVIIFGALLFSIVCDYIIYRYVIYMGILFLSLIYMLKKKEEILQLVKK